MSIERNRSSFCLTSGLELVHPHQGVPVAALGGVGHGLPPPALGASAAGVDVAGEYGRVLGPLVAIRAAAATVGRCA